MERTVYGVLSRVAGVILVIVGILAIWGGTFAHGYVKEQLSQERITMPADAALTTPEMKSALGKWSGTPLDSGPKAKAYANNYILEHMNASSQGKTYSEVSGEYTKLSKDTTADPAAVKKLGDLRQTLFMGDTLRGLLLSAYGWGLIGTIALYGGVALVIIGVILAALGFGPLRSKKTV
ncbi:hypothetical protein GA0111570_10728 [Raineyella antarctica]|uniref:Aromatic ring-opening dioxygenase LigA n=1 Tax=Raineyella antarctica TaxID=1577474 RepID=A0A1G6H6G6_9ACTN|nr:hypothetical protein [Raineyella antarctica]SDB89822.1 hypothetical protein GA0111570_10728 [Raineyella antarctica]